MLADSANNAGGKGGYYQFLQESRHHQLAVGGRANGSTQVSDHQSGDQSGESWVGALVPGNVASGGRESGGRESPTPRPDGLF